MDKKNRNFSCNTNPLGPPPAVLEILRSNLKEMVTSYPNHTNVEAIKAISAYYNIPARNILIGNGATEFLLIIPKAFDIKFGLVLSPTFWEYAFSLKRFNKPIKYFNLKASEFFHINMSGLERTIAEAGQSNNIFYVCNPNNPTGTLTAPDKILNLVKKFPRTMFVVDETYLLFHSNYHRLSLMKEAHKRLNLTVVTSLSKFFSVPGLRLGILTSSAQNLSRIKKHQVLYGINSFAQQIVPSLFDDKSFIDRSRKYISIEKDRVYKKLSGFKGLALYDSSANFILAKLTGGSIDSTILCNELQKEEIVIRNGCEFKNLGKKYIRFCLKNSIENDVLFNKIRQILNHKDSS